MSYKLDMGSKWQLGCGHCSILFHQRCGLNLAWEPPCDTSLSEVLSREEIRSCLWKDITFYMRTRGMTPYTDVSRIFICNLYRKIRERIKEWHLFWYDNKASVRRGWDITLYTYGMRNHLEDILFGTRNHLIVRYQDISYAEDILFGMRTKQYWIPGIGKPHVSNFIVCFVD